MGCMVQSVAAAMDLPDSVFIEDTAVVFDEIAVIARPGASSRQRETEAVAAALARYRRLAAISAPATLDGGDVLRIGRDVYLGISGRTNGDGVRQLTDLIAPHGYRVHTGRNPGLPPPQERRDERPRRSARRQPTVGRRPLVPGHAVDCRRSLPSRSGPTCSASATRSCATRPCREPWRGSRAAASPYAPSRCRSWRRPKAA